MGFQKKCQRVVRAFYDILPEGHHPAQQNHPRRHHKYLFSFEFIYLEFVFDSILYSFYVFVSRFYTHVRVWLCYFNGWRSIEIATDRFTPGEAYAFTQYKPRDKPANGYNYVAQPSNGKCICRGSVLYTPAMRIYY